MGWILLILLVILLWPAIRGYLTYRAMRNRAQEIFRQQQQAQQEAERKAQEEAERLRLEAERLRLETERLRLEAELKEKEETERKTREEVENNFIVCPNCGAKIKSKTEGTCEYCGSHVVISPKDYVLSEKKIIT